MAKRQTFEGDPEQLVVRELIAPRWLVTATWEIRLNSEPVCVDLRVQLISDADCREYEESTSADYYGPDQGDRDGPLWQSLENFSSLLDQEFNQGRDVTGIGLGVTNSVLRAAAPHGIRTRLVADQHKMPESMWVEVEPLDSRRPGVGRPPKRPLSETLDLLVHAGKLQREGFTRQEVAGRLSMSDSALRDLLVSARRHDPPLIPRTSAGARASWSLTPAAQAMHDKINKGMD